VRIGLTTEQYLQAHPKPFGSRIRPYAERRRDLVAFLTSRWPRARWRVVPLRTVWGGAASPGVDLLVLTADTRGGGSAVNAERERRGLGPLRLKFVRLVRAQDGSPIASRRIRAGEIDREGHARTPSVASRTPHPRTGHRETQK
jgi:pantetheine-phosphate adenylyltransferase